MTIKNSALAVLVIISVLFVSSFSEAQVGQLRCPVFQITDGDENSSNGRLCGNGEGILFNSRADLLNNGHPVQEDLFFADISNPHSPIFYQLTNEPGSLNYSISDDCKTIAVSTDRDLTGDNPNNRDQIFYGDISNPGNPVFTQITQNTTNRSIFNAEISGDGTKVTFFTEINISGLNPNGDITYYVFDINNQANPFAALTNQISPSSSTFEPEINGDGSRVTFASTGNYDPPNRNPQRVQQIFLSEITYNPPAPTPSELFQITGNTINLPAQEFAEFKISADGSTLVFSSFLNLTGMNESGVEQIFTAAINDPTNPMFYQITNVSGEFNVSNTTINTSGDKIGFLTTATEFNSSESRENIVVADISDPTSPIFTLITDFSPETNLVRLDGSNDLSLFSFDSNRLGGEVNTRQIYVVENCNLPRAVPTLSEWGMIAMAGVIGIVGVLFFVRRRVAA